MTGVRLGGLVQDLANIVGKFNEIHKTAKIADSARVCGWCYIGPGVTIGANTVISNFCEINSNASIGDNTLINSFCNIVSDTVIGSDTIIGSGVVTADEKYMTARTGNIKKQPCTIGNDCRIGANTVLVSTKLEDHVSIGAGSTVLEPHIKSREVWAGTPARFLRMMTDFELSI